MRHVIVPSLAWILCRGKGVVADLVVGDQVQAYDYRNQKVCMATITGINPVESARHMLLPIERFKMIPITKETVGLTSVGEKTLEETRQYIGYCHTNPGKLLERNFSTALEQHQLQQFEGIVADAVELQWESPDYIWFEGILVGTSFG